MATEEDFVKVREFNISSKMRTNEEEAGYQAGWNDCLEYAISNGLPSDLPNIGLELKRAYLEIDKLQSIVSSVKDARKMIEKSGMGMMDNQLILDCLDLALAPPQVISK